MKNNFLKDFYKIFSTEWICKIHDKNDHNARVL
jgi:hypothetical protein